MLVICKKGNKRLLKGHRYEVQNLWNNGSNQRWLEGKIELTGFGRYSISNFTDVDGKELSKINFNKPAQVNKKLIEFSDLSIGDIIVCTSDHYKTMIKDGLYKIEDLKEESISYIGWNNTKYSRIQRSIKFVGIKRYLKFNGWFFRKLSPEESREISLNSVLNMEEPNIIKTSSIRKIDSYSNKENILMNILSKSILDTNRHHLSIVDWCCEKSGHHLGLKSSDFENILNLPLRDILKKIENT